jgi:hypothetical protein
MFSKRPPKGGQPNLEARIRRIAENPPVERAPIAPAAPSRPPRTPTFRQATLLFGAGQSLEVVVKNISHNGARVEFFVHAEIPTEVVFSASSIGVRRPARVVWRRDWAVGLRFLDEDGK